MYFIGDTHGIRPIFTIIDKHKLENQNLIHVGDLGLGFQDIRRDIRNLEMLDQMLGETGNTLYVIRGNHDNPIFWDNLWLPRFDNLVLVKDYSIIRIEDKNILFSGGATSIDRTIRRDENPPTWWKDEKFTYDHDYVNKILSKISTIDIVVTHSAPHFAYPQNDYVTIVDHYCEIEKQHGVDLRKELREERNLHSILHTHLMNFGFKPTHWIYGHFHSTKKDKIIDTEFKLLNINELYELK